MNPEIGQADLARELILLGRKSSMACVFLVGDQVKIMEAFLKRMCIMFYYVSGFLLPTPKGLIETIKNGEYDIDV